MPTFLGLFALVFNLICQPREREVEDRNQIAIKKTTMMTTTTKKQQQQPLVYSWAPESSAAVIVFVETVFHASKTGCRWLGPWGSGWGSRSPGCQMWLYGMVNKRAGPVANHCPAGLFGARSVQPQGETEREEEERARERVREVGSSIWSLGFAATCLWHTCKNR